VCEDWIIGYRIKNDTFEPWDDKEFLIKHKPLVQNKTKYENICYAIFLSFPTAFFMPILLLVWNAYTHTTREMIKSQFLITLPIGLLVGLGVLIGIGLGKFAPEMTKKRLLSKSAGAVMRGGIKDIKSLDIERHRNDTTKENTMDAIQELIDNKVITNYRLDREKQKLFTVK
jgi:hypothetical protein